MGAGCYARVFKASNLDNAQILGLSIVPNITARETSAMSNTILWHDYETSGTDPRRDRPLQFAAIRTDEDLNPIGEPQTFYCKPAKDLLPNPEACLVTGITPQYALEHGLTEVDFMARVHDLFSRPGTCGAGYNSLRFDDEVIRHGLYRNLLDPYAREWRNGNSRWDLIDLMRACRALRPDGIVWPDHEDGRPSFRLEDLSAANGLEHTSVHDALSDVQATIALGKLIKRHQPRLWAYYYGLRRKRTVQDQRDIPAMKPVLHVSGMYGHENGFTTLGAPVCEHPTNPNGVLMFDLRHDPKPFLELSAEVLRERLFTPKDALPEDEPRLPVKTLHINRSPMVAPIKTLDPTSARRLDIDVAQCRRNADTLRTARPFIHHLRDAFGGALSEAPKDPDLMLYAGGFLGDADRGRLDRVRAARGLLTGLDLNFDDPRLEEMVFRFRARNFPQTLNEKETTRWEDYRYVRLTEPHGGGSIHLDAYYEELHRLGDDPKLGSEKSALLEALWAWGEYLLD